MNKLVDVTRKMKNVRLLNGKFTNVLHNQEPEQLIKKRKEIHGKEARDKKY
jgi:hypothetical protein